MNPEPRPLPTGTLLVDRFRIERVLGKGGFSLAYEAVDAQRGDHVVVKELAPTGIHRREDLVLDLDVLGSAQAVHLRQRFLDEALLLGRLRVRGLLPVRASFCELGTAYFATDYIAGAVTLDEVMKRERKLNAQGALDLLYQLLETLEEVHRRGYLHRDIKPSNILVSPKGEAILIDFGAAREWHADATVHNTVLFTPGYAPIEQLSERSRRGPATDLYALAATFYHALTGSIPPTGAERLDGVTLTPIRAIRPDVDEGAAFALEACLQPRYADRPQSISDVRDLLAKEPQPDGPNSLESFDQKLTALRTFTFGRRECPSCGGVLEEPKPLRHGTCPVCRRGAIRRREIGNRLCPNCTASTLQRVANVAPLALCPLCRFGRLSRRRKKGLLSNETAVECLACSAVWQDVRGVVTLADPGSSQRPAESPTDWEGWRAFSGRAREVWICDGCDAQYDPQPDRRWRQMRPAPRKYAALYPEEWARVAAHLEPDAGNGECDACGAEYFLDGSKVTLIGATHDPFGFEKTYAGRLLSWEDLQWLGVGKESAAPGFSCPDCGTEFDKEQGYLRLVRTDNRRLRRRLGEARTLEDWHRLAKDLPGVADEAEFVDSAEQVLENAYLLGDLSFDLEDTILWRGPAERVSDGQNSVLSVTTSEVSFGGRLRKWKVPFDVILGTEADGDILHLRLSGYPEPESFVLEPLELTAHLKSGRSSMVLNAWHLARRIRLERGF